MILGHEYNWQSGKTLLETFDSLNSFSAIIDYGLFYNYDGEGNALFFYDCTLKVHDFLLIHEKVVQYIVYTLLNFNIAST